MILTLAPGHNIVVISDRDHPDARHLDLVAIETEDAGVYRVTFSTEQLVLIESFAHAEIQCRLNAAIRPIEEPA